MQKHREQSISHYSLSSFTDFQPVFQDFNEVEKMRTNLMFCFISFVVAMPVVCNDSEEKLCDRAI